MAHDEHSRHPNDELKHALESLQAFVKQNDEATIPTLYKLDVKDGHVVVDDTTSPLHKMVDLTRHFFALAFSDHLREDLKRRRELVKRALVKAVAVISSHYPLIDEKLKGEDIEEQRFAEGALDVIRRYNATITKDTRSCSWTQRLVEYLYEHNQLILDEEVRKSVIILPQAASFDSDSSLRGKKVRLSSNDSSVSQKFSTVQPSQPEVDAFRMKAITLINKHEIPTPIQEAVSSLKETPIVIEHHGERSEEREPSPHAVISLQQVLTPFPGEVIKLSGSFKRNPQTTLLSTPIPESFRVSSQSTQTAFPHPLQHVGWALADALIPNYPLRPDQLPLFHKMAEKKREVAYALLPKGHLRTRAKAMIEGKKAAFERDKTAFIALHKQLALAMVSAAGPMSDQHVQTIDSFYLHVEKQLCVYDYVSGVYQLLEERCLSSLQKRLYSEWLEKGHPGLRGSDDKKKAECVQELMQDELNRQLGDIKGPEAEYLSLLGVRLGKAAVAIILQAMSEKIGTAPPMLSDFEQKVQVCALRQVQTFLSDIEKEVSDIGGQMKAILQAEIALFSAAFCDDEISDELEDYFNSRFHSKK